MATPSPYDHEHENEIIPFGVTNFRGQERRFGIKTDDRRRHVYVIGKTGMGKTTLLENFVLADINAGHGLAYIDPHGDTADKILDYIPPHRLNDVVYFNPSDMEFPVGFNILEIKNENQKHLVASGLMGVFKKIWPDVWSPRMEYILLNCILALLDTPGSTLVGISRILADKAFRKTIVNNVKDPVVKSFWINEFGTWTDKFASEAIAPVQNKVGQFLSNTIIRNIVAQPQSTIDVRKIMDERKILIVNLSKGLVGEDSSKLLGGMLITRLQLAAMERVDIMEKDRQDFYLYVDEFQNFATESFANILSEARKYRLALITAHQYIEQLEEEVAAAIFGNVGTIISFRVGASDAEHLAKEFAPTFVEEDIINLAKYEVYMKLMIDGVASTPFSAKTMAPIAKIMHSKEKVVTSSRERFAIKREVIEEKVNSWSGFGSPAPNGSLPVAAPAPAAPGAPHATMTAAPLPNPAGATPQAAPFVATGDRQYQAKCARCGKELRLKFPPDPSRPFFCKECLPLAKAEGLTAPPPKPKPAAPPAPPVPKAPDRPKPSAERREPPKPAPASAERPRAPKPIPPPAGANGAFGGKIRIVKEEAKEALSVEAPKREESKKEAPKKAETPVPSAAKPAAPPVPPPPPAALSNLPPPPAPRAASSGPIPLIPGKKITFE